PDAPRRRLREAPPGRRRLRAARACRRPRAGWIHPAMRARRALPSAGHRAKGPGPSRPGAGSRHDARGARLRPAAPARGPRRRAQARAPPGLHQAILGPLAMNDPVTRSVVAAVVAAAAILVVYFGAPLVPVAVGSLAAGAWVWWRGKRSG